MENECLDLLRPRFETVGQLADSGLTSGAAGDKTCRAEMKRDQRVLDLLISVHQLGNQQGEGRLLES